MEDNKKKIINILCAIIVLCIIGLLASIVIKVINKNKENQIKEESTEFFDDYLYTFNSSFGKKIGYFENIDEEDYSKFAVLYYYQNLEDKSANTFTISREKIEKIVFKYFNIRNFDLKETDETKELFQVKKLQNTYKIDINPVDFGYDSYKISNVTYNDNEVTVKYDIYQGNTTDTNWLNTDDWQQVDDKSEIYSLLSNINNNIDYLNAGNSFNSNFLFIIEFIHIIKYFML